MTLPLHSLYYDLQRAARHTARQKDDQGTLGFVVQTVTLGAVLFLGNALARKMLRDLGGPLSPGRA